MPARTKPALPPTEVCLREVEQTLRAAARQIPKAKARERGHYMKAVMPLYGLTVPRQRQILKKGYSFSDLPPKTQFPIWDHIWFQAEFHEAKMQAIFFVNSHAGEYDSLELWKLTKSWSNDINCWDQADELSKRYSFLYENEPEFVYSTFQDWNKHADLWKRRVSVVSLMCYARLHAWHPPLNKILPLVSNLIGDDEKYVQKGVGWTLREAYNVYPRKVFDFVLNNCGDIHPIAFTAAIEKMSAREKDRIKKQRKSKRSQFGRQSNSFAKQ